MSLVDRIRSWHVGQLVIVWAVALFLGTFLVSVASEIPRSARESYTRPCRRPAECRTFVYGTGMVPDPGATVTDYRDVHKPWGDALLVALGGTVLLVLPASTLAVTWVWFGGRRRGR